MIEQEKDRDFRLSALFDIARSSYTGGQNTLKRVTLNQAEDPCVRLAASSALARSGDPTGRDIALVAVTNASPCSELGIETLVRLRAISVISLLQQKLNSTQNIQVRDSARLAILRLQMIGKNVPEIEGLIQSILTERGFHRVYEWAGLYLGSIGDLRALQILKSTVKSKDISAAQGAVMGLGVGVEKGHWTQKQAAE